METVTVNPEPILCPKCAGQFFLRWRKVKMLQNELQHHLYMAHKLDVIESHKIAAELTAGVQERVWKKQGVTR